MERLTYKLDEPLSNKYLHYEYMIIADYDINKGNYGRITNDKIYNKLGRLEDIEKELGIDLITLFKALKEGIYYKTINSSIYHIPDTCLELEYAFGEFNLWVDAHKTLDGLLINLKDYGKSWSLRKEDLEDDEKED